MKRHAWHAILGLGLAVTLLLNSGCIFLINWARGEASNTVAYRYDFELVPDAQLVRENTQPVWPLGRFAFEPGADRLLVITRTTSLAQRDENGNVVEPVQRYDRWRERIWITLPMTAEVGDRLDLFKLRELFFTGYDHADLESGRSYFIQPYQLQGYVEIVEMTDQFVRLQLHMTVDPDDRERWTMEGLYRVPVTPQGVYASRPVREFKAIRPYRLGTDPGEPWLAQSRQDVASVNPDGVLDSVERDADPMPPSPTGDAPQADPGSRNPAGTPGASDGNQPSAQGSIQGGGDQTEGQAADSSPNPQADQAPGAAEAADPDQAQEAGEDPQAADVGEVDGRPVTGQWIGRVPGYEMRFQFEADGTFVYTDQRQGYVPGAMYGEYQVKKNYLIMRVNRWEFGGDDHMKFLDGNPYIMVRAGWEGDTLTLSGDFRTRIGKQFLRVKRTSFPDMKKTLPPTDAMD